MEIFNSKKFIMLIVLIILLAGLTGCAKKVVYTENPKLPDAVEKTGEKQTMIDSVGKMEGVANALACIFSPETCEATKQEREMDR